MSALPPPVPGSAAMAPPPDRASPLRGADGVDDSIEPRRLHPLSPVLSGGVAILRFWPLLLLALARATWVPMIVLAVAVVVWRSMVWLRTTWSLREDALEVRSGILWRNVQTVPPQRVQQVEVRQALRHRATGLAVVRIGLAGGGDASQVELDALSMPDAERLRVVLERWRARAGAVTGGTRSGSATDAPDSAGLVRDGAAVHAPAITTVFTAGTWHLVAAGLTSRSLWLAPLAGFAALVQFLSDARLDDDATDAIRSRLSDASPAVTLVTVMVLALGAAVVSTVISNHGLTVSRSGEDLTVERGLLERRSAVVPRRRVQTLELGTNPVRAALGLAALDIRTADLGAARESASSTSLPIGRREQLEALTVQLLPTAEPMIPTERHPPAALRREIVRRTLRLVPLFTFLGVLIGGVDATAAVVGMVAGVVLAVGTGWPAGRRRRSGWTATTIVAEFGYFSWRRSIVPVDRVQSVATEQNPLQRRLGVVTVRLDVAGTPGGVSLRDLGLDQAARVLEVVVTDVVTSDPASAPR